ncbi:MAG TPA: lipoprotein LpqH [Mycobacterium sp.]|nr:lipoprotein LpqH [Mycobacterium sp.]
MKRGFLVAVGGAAIVIAGLSGCGSDEKKSETSGETSAAATAEGKSTVTIDGQDQNVSGTVTCATMGGNVNIALGGTGTASGIGAVVSEGDSPTVQSVALGNINGVSLGYAPGTPGAEAKAEKDDKTYKISGTATGMDMANPLQPVTKPFEIEVTCP